MSAVGNGPAGFVDTPVRFGSAHRAAAVDLSFSEISFCRIAPVIIQFVNNADLSSDFLFRKIMTIASVLMDHALLLLHTRTDVSSLTPLFIWGSRFPVTCNGYA